MSAATRSAVASKSRDRASDARTPAVIPNPFKPRRGLFAAMATVNLLWIGALIWMYLATVRNAPSPRAADDAAGHVQRELQRELDDLNATTRPGADGSPSAPR